MRLAEYPAPERSLGVSIPLRKFLRPVVLRMGAADGAVSIPLRKFLRSGNPCGKRCRISSFHPFKEVFEVGPEDAAALAYPGFHPFKEVFEGIAQRGDVDHVVVFPSL